MCTWDSHTVRVSRHQHSPTGKPCVLYHLPELYGCQDYVSHVDSDDIVICAEECMSKSELSLDNDLCELIHIITNENGWMPPHSASSAAQLYLNIRTKVRALLV